MTFSRVIAASVIAATLTGCSARPESVLLDRFFAAARLRDHTLLQTFSTVPFEPDVQGIITSFEITNVTQERQDGAVVSKEVSISAPVQLPDGQTALKQFVVTLQRPRPGHDAGVATGWMITSITDAPAAVSSPRS